jgi:hypothetical protein
MILRESLWAVLTGILAAPEANEENRDVNFHMVDS